jgi:integrase
MSSKTAYEYSRRLHNFAIFVKKEYRLSVDELIITLTKIGRGPKIDIYELLSSYVSYLQKTDISSLSVKMFTTTIKNFLEFNDVEISPRKFKLKVRMPKVIRASKEPLTKEDIIEIIHACSFNLKLQTYIMFLASTGARANEATSIRLCDYDSNKGKVSIRGQFTKTKADRYVSLTTEMNKQMQAWLSYKYRTRDIVSYNKDNTKKTQIEVRSPLRNEEDFIFSSKVGEANNTATVRGMYITLVTAFEKALDRLGKGAYEDSKKRRRKITLHSFRRFVKSTISNLGYGDYSEWYIGHVGSTYYRVSDKEKAELFNKIAPHLTFMDYSALERQGADIQTKLETMEKENIELKKIMQNMKSKTDRIDSSLEKLDKLKKKLAIS